MFKRLSLVNKILLLQFLVTILVSGIFALAKGYAEALNPLLGGLTAFVPNLYFALRVSRSYHQEPKKIVNSFYAGESGKLILTAALFMLVFQFPNIKLLPLLTGYVAVLSIFWIALLLRD